MFFTAPGDEPRSLPRTLNEQRRDGTDVVFDELWSMLYFDTAGTGAWAPAVEFTASVVGADHMVFGTDFPLEAHSPETMRELVEMLSHLDLPEESRGTPLRTGARSRFLERRSHTPICKQTPRSGDTHQKQAPVSPSAARRRSGGRGNSSHSPRSVVSAEVELIALLECLP